MTNKIAFSALTIGSLLGFAAVLGAFAPVPLLPAQGQSEEIVRLAADNENMYAPADNDTDSDNSTAATGERMASDSSPDADNSEMNQGDLSTHKKTADSAGNSSNDRMMMSKIRKAVIADNSLSTSAHNVKIIATNGKVTLKGPVQSDQEKQSIEAKAVEVAGSGNVVDKIKVKSNATAAQ